MGNGTTNTVSLIDARRCNASTFAACHRHASALTSGIDPVGIAIDGTTHTVYVANASGTVAVLDSRSCTAARPTGASCTRRPSASGSRLLGSAFSSSPYLASLALRSPTLVAECLVEDPDAHLLDACNSLAAGVATAGSAREVMMQLRRFKRRIALLAGLADLGGVWPTEDVLHAMSVAADAALEQATAFLFRKAREAGQIKPTAGEGTAAPGYFVIAMGKLGAIELNYSSDIDLIVFYDAERAGLSSRYRAVAVLRPPDPRAGALSAGAYRRRLCVPHRSAGSAPIPGATQIALSTDAGLTYYESFGQNWERAALIKARIAAGDVATGEEFLRQLSPFVWRKYLDFAAIADIHAMKRRVHEFKGHGAIAVEGHDIKLGRGGIRDIEFFTQTQQLIAGGRHPELRTPRHASRRSGDSRRGGWIAREAARELTDAYLFLRRIENRLQMVGDQQTHVIPAERDELASVAKLSGFADTGDFGDALIAAFRAGRGALRRAVREAAARADLGAEHRRRLVESPTRPRWRASSDLVSAIRKLPSPRCAPGNPAATPRRGARGRASD